MRRFRFRLDPLLRLRQQYERTARRELAKAMTAVSTLEQRSEAAVQGVRDCAEQAAAPGAMGLFARALETGLRRHQWRLQGELKQAEQRLSHIRGDYVQKNRELRALQELRGQRQQAWRQAHLQAEQAELDAMAAQRTALAVQQQQGRQ